MKLPHSPHASPSYPCILAFCIAVCLLSIVLGCQIKYAKDFVYADGLNLNDEKSEAKIGVSCRKCDRLDCSQRAFPPDTQNYDVNINQRGVSIFVNV